MSGLSLEISHLSIRAEKKKSNEENHIDKGGRATEAILLGHEKGMDRIMVSLELLIDKKVFERVQKNHAHKRLAKTNAQIADNPHKNTFD